METYEVKGYKYEVKGYTKTGVYSVVVTAPNDRAALRVGKVEIQKMALGKVRAWKVRAWG